MMDFIKRYYQSYSNWFIALLLTAATFVIHGTIVDGNWRWHDAQILFHLYNYPWYADFINPLVWQEYSPVNLTPWQVILYRLDYLLAGISPLIFYLHHVLALAATATALFFVNALWVQKRFAIVSALLLLVGTPVFFVSEQLMTRHYVEGTLYALVSLYLFVTGIRQSSQTRILASAALYAMAMASKEIFVPLAILLLAVPEGTFRARLKLLTPHFLLLAIYIIWRDHMLASVVGGYGASSNYIDPEFMVTAAGKFLRIPVMLFAGAWWIASLAFMTLVVLTIRAGRFPWLITLLAGAMLLGPLYPLAGAPDRYLFLVWVGISFSVGWMLHHIRHSPQTSRLLPVALTSVGILCVFSYTQGQQVRADLGLTATEFDVHTTFMLSTDSASAFIPTTSLAQDYWAVTDMLALGKALTGKDGPVPLPDDLFLTESIDHLFSYDSGCQCMQDISAALPDRRAAFVAANRPDAPLTAEFLYQNGLMSWKFGPYETGEFHVVSEVMGRLPVPVEIEGLRITVAQDTPIHIRYQSPEGWITYSDRLIIRHGIAGHWTRQ